MLRYQNIILDFGENMARDPDLAPIPVTSGKWVLNDGLVLRLQFQIKGTGGEMEALEISEQAVLELGVKKKGEYDGTLLVYSGPELWNRAGDWAEANRSEGRCSVLVNLNTKELRDEFSSSTEEVEVLVDVCITEPGEAQTTVQFGRLIINDVLKLNQDEGASQNPDFATLDYVDAAVQAVTTPPAGYYKLESGKLFLWDIALETYFPVSLNDQALIVEDI